MLHNCRWLAACLLALLSATPALARMDDPLISRLTTSVLQQAFPGAEAIGEISGEPPIAEVLIEGEVAGYVMSVHDIMDPKGFAGEPFDLMVGLDIDGKVKGVVLLDHFEPIIGLSMIRPELMQAFLDRLRKVRVNRSVRARGGVADGVSGATVSSKLMRSAALASARKVAVRTGIADTDVDPRGLSVDIYTYEERGWEQLIADAEVVGRTVTFGDVMAAFGGAARELERKPPDQTFIEIYTMLSTPGGIGRNIFDDEWYNFHLTQIAPGDHFVTIAALGFYSFRAAAKVDLQPFVMDTFPRIQIVQGDKVFKLSVSNKLKRTAIQADGAPRFREHMLFRMTREEGFDPLSPWTLELLVEPATVGAPADSETAVFPLTYSLPDKYVEGEDYALEEAGYKTASYVFFGLLRESLLAEWQQVWAARVFDIGILLVILGAVTAMLLFQDALSRRRRLFTWLRIGVLAAVLVWLGWMKDAQLTTINVITYAQAALEDLDPGVFLLDPLIFILSVYAGVTLLLWGRGVFCGWLCPFGAMQELLARAARVLRVPQITLSQDVQERAWVLKYVIAVIILALSLWSMDATIFAAEVEPFKTAIIVGLDRSWPYILYAGVLLALGLTIERFFCRFLCPLGACLSILGRARLLNWLKRRPLCGRPCNICQGSCPVGAIRNDGVIDMNECFQCLECQVDYYDIGKCPPLVSERKRAKRAEEMLPVAAE
jgi:NosR/NirI family transcriptional regulator, nitrous oxide reductase regulator